MSDNAVRSLTLSMRCYRGLLRAYPQPFLAEFEELMIQAFGDLAQRAVRTQGSWGLFVLWMRTVPDLISSAFSQRLRLSSDWSFRLKWITACTVGIALAAIWILGPWYFIYATLRWFGTLPRYPVIVTYFARVPRSAINAHILRDAAVFGLMLGFFQSLSLGLKSARRGGWIFATTIGTTIATGVLLMIPYVANYLRVTIHPWRFLVEQHPGLYYGSGAVLFLSVTGMLQSMVLARGNPRALAWVPASAIGFLVFGVEVYVRMPLVLMLGFVYGVVTVLPMEWILRGRTAEVELSSGSVEAS